MSPRLKTVLAVVGSFVLGGGLLYLALRGVDFAAVGAALAGADWWWLLPLLGATLAAHTLRAWRWKLMLETLPGRDGQAAAVPFRVAFYSVMIGYMVNYAAPRAGEVARAANVAAQTPLHFPGVLGTVVAERVLDVLALGVALLSILALYRTRLAGVLGTFFENAAAALPPIPWAVVAVALVVTVVALMLLARVLFRRLSPGGPSGASLSLGGIVRSFRDGLLSLLRLRRKGAVLLATASIWGLYAVMADIPLRMLGLSEAYGLGLLDAWALMGVGAIGMALPSPGGTGTYHYVTVETLVLLFGVAAAPAATYALFSHAAQLVLYATGGFLCLLLQGTSVRALRERAARAGPETGAAPAEV